jgi:hypothetical protein
MLSKGVTNIPRAICQTEELEAFAKQHFPEKFLLTMIDRNVQAILAAGGDLMRADFNEFPSFSRY